MAAARAPSRHVRDGLCSSPRRRRRRARRVCAGKAEGGNERLAMLAARAAASPAFWLSGGVAAALGAKQVLGESAGVVALLAGAPVVGLTALSRSGVGESLQADLAERLPALRAEAEQRRARWEAARAASPLYGPSRWTLLGSAPPHLDGTLPADAGFDVLGLGADGRLDRMRELELLHARWAMLGAVGAVVPELIDTLAPGVLGESVWWRVGKAKLEPGATLDYLGAFRIAGGQALPIIVVCQLLLMGGPEYARSVGLAGLEPVGIFLPGTRDYPGGDPFDPLDRSADAEAFVAEQARELWVGRLAMVACLGFAAQAWVTQEGPVANLAWILQGLLQ